MAIKTIEILNVMVFKRHLRKNNAAFESIKEGDSFHDGFKLEFCDGINVLIGENGVGKTTILKMIYAATQWSIRQTDQGKTKRFVQFFSNSLKDSDALKNAENKEDDCYYRVSDGTHSFEDSLSHKAFFNYEEWSRVYEESLELVKAFPLAERGTDTYAGKQVICAVRTRERKIGSGEKWGWCAQMDYDTLHGAENYYLPKNLVDSKDIDKEA